MWVTQRFSQLIFNRIPLLFFFASHYLMSIYKTCDMFMLVQSSPKANECCHQPKYRLSFSIVFLSDFEQARTSCPASFWNQVEFSKYAFSLLVWVTWFNLFLSEYIELIIYHKVVEKSNVQIFDIYKPLNNFFCGKQCIKSGKR